MLTRHKANRHYASPFHGVSCRRGIFLPTYTFWLVVVRIQASFNSNHWNTARAPESLGSRRVWALSYPLSTKTNSPQASKENSLRRASETSSQAGCLGVGGKCEQTHHRAGGHPLAGCPQQDPVLWPSSPSGPTAFHKYVGRSLSHVTVHQTRRWWPLILLSIDTIFVFLLG